MAGLISVSRKDLSQRRQKLRQQRRIRIIHTIWRTLAASGIAGGLLWATLQPIWVLKSPSQIVIRADNKLLSKRTIQSLLVISYPQSLWRIEPSNIADTLEKQPAIAQATVNRRMFPPGLIIEIEEKLPVATTHSLSGKSAKNCQTKSKSSQTSCPKDKTVQDQKSDVNVLDAHGNVISWQKYRAINPHGQLPNLKVVGLPQQYRSFWPPLYQAVSQSSVKITEINCQDPTNLILKTELGNVHLGVPTQLPEKLSVLVQIRDSKPKFNSQPITYIDLKNPYQPLVQMN